MASRINVEGRGQTRVALPPGTSADDKALSNLIGGLLLFGLAWGGLALGYASAAMQWLGTAVLVVPGSLLAGTGIWNLVSNKPR